MVTGRIFATLTLGFTLTLGCNNASKDGAAPPRPKPSAASAEPVPEGSLRLGAAIEASAPKVPLAEVAKNPAAFAGKKFATSGTVTAVCQHMGCWMEIKDDASEAHIKMSGHSFFVPKTASGRKALVLSTLLKSADSDSCGDDSDGKMAASGAESHGKGKGCKAEAEEQLGHPLAKLELVAEGVELR